MNRSVHMFVGLSFGVFTCPHIPYLLFAALMGAMGGWLPDQDLHYYHRKTLHNFFAWISATLIVYGSLLLLFTNNGISEEWVECGVVGFSGGMLLHILLDSLTKKGVYILYPFSDKIRLRIPLFKSSSGLANGFGIMIGFLFLFLWFERMGFEAYIHVFWEILTSLVSP